MIDYIRGIVTEKEFGHVTLEAGGIGYSISIPLSTYEQLPASGMETTLKTHYHVREDAHKLFGFFSREERELFRLLIGVSKIGPKVALSILSGISMQDLVQSINSGDPVRLQKIPGVGLKTAQRLVMELKGKVETGHAHPAFRRFEGVAAPLKNSGSGALPIREEVFEAMVALGYNEKQVNRALERIGPVMQEDEPVEAWIRKALQVI